MSDNTNSFCNIAHRNTAHRIIMATDLSSLLTQQRKQLDALAIETQQRFAELKTEQEDVVLNTQKRVKDELSVFEKQVDRLLNDTRKRLEKELAKQVAQSLFGDGQGSAGGQSQGQAMAQFSSLLSSAFRNL